jgi:hypothetical protein
MALLYPWATKEYLLWKMSLGQIILYYNLGTESKYGKGEGETSSLKNLSHEKLKKLKDELYAQYGEIDG